MAAQTTNTITLKKCSGDTLRTLRVRTRPGWRLIGSRAVVRKTRLKGNPRTLRVDLRGKSAGNYNVYITARYKRGKVTKTVRSQRHLSVVCQ